MFLIVLPLVVGFVIGRWPGLMLAAAVLAVPASGSHCTASAVEDDWVVTECGGGLVWWELTGLVVFTALLLAAGITARRNLQRRWPDRPRSRVAAASRVAGDS